MEKSKTLSIKCGSIPCKWSNEAGDCTFDGTILLNDCLVTTVKGKKRYHKCMRYEESDEYKEAKKMFLGKLR